MAKNKKPTDDTHTARLVEVANELNELNERRAKLVAERDALIMESELTGYKIWKLTGVAQSYVGTLRRAARLAQA